ncbi:hypothetical protein [Hyalangium gracile]|uniref:hypothetical protein n=1 Tax=Hyalangium gracile TaxID=394092 RepID=UPI001CCE5DDF|nr:hypothetical protein [Hyalangium gracile]
MKVRARSWRQWVRGAGVSVLLVLGGCGQALPGEGGDETGMEWETQEAAIRIPNSLSTQALTLNALTTNPTANQMMGTSSLTSLFLPPGNPYINTQLKDPNAQQLMKYVVSCALKTGQDLKWTNPLTGLQDVWPGSLGLCPEWATQAPSPGCLERVSSCLLARNNAFGLRVELSVRGEHPTNLSAYPLEAVARPSAYDPDTSSRLASISECELATLGAARNCGWAVDSIGSCTPGQTVRLGAGGRAPDDCTGPMLGSSNLGRAILRVCDGIAGCDNASQRMLAQSQGSCSQLAPAVSFTCPASGYFNVMKGSFNSNLAVLTTVQVAAPADYRLSEAEVFAQREGAYYGTIFDPGALAVQVYVEGDQVIGRGQVVHGSVYLRMYSCFDAGWTAGAATAAHRVCALPSSGSNCAAKVVGTCVDPSHRSYPTSMCATEDGSRVEGDGDFAGCRDNTGTLWAEPLTVYLNQACDVTVGSPKSGVCQRK